MRTGITTGTCAAAAAKAAALAWLGKAQDTVTVVSPQGKPITVVVNDSLALPDGGLAGVVKDAGDDPDITNGVRVEAKVIIEIIEKKEASNSTDVEIIIKAGEGVGTVTKPGLSVPVGSPAINNGPQVMINAALKEVFLQSVTSSKLVKAEVTISIPGGELLAKRTLNPVLGIEGGLSVIGTTGIVEPMSEEAFKNSLVPQLGVVKAAEFSDVVFVPGKIGWDIAVNRYGLPAEAIVQTSNFIGHMLENAAALNFKRVLIFGHLGKIVKVSAGIFHTHNRMADARMEILAANISALGAEASVVREVLAATTTEAAMLIIAEHKLEAVYNVLAEKASLRAVRYVFGDLEAGTAIVSLKGDLLGLDQAARGIGGILGWNAI